MDLVGGRVAEVLAGMMGGAFVEVGDAFWRGVKAAGRPEMGTQRRRGGGGAEGERERGEAGPPEMGDGEPPEGGTTERGVRDGWKPSLLGGEWDEEVERGGRKWRLCRVGAPAGWLGESGSGLPQSKAGCGLRDLGRRF